MVKRWLTSKDVPALAGAAMLGHTWIVIEHHPDGDRQAVLCSTGARAVESAGDLQHAYTIYTQEPKPRHGRIAWREVRPQAAVLDG